MAPREAAPLAMLTRPVTGGERRNGQSTFTVLLEVAARHLSATARNCQVSTAGQIADVMEEVDARWLAAPGGTWLGRALLWLEPARSPPPSRCLSVRPRWMDRVAAQLACIDGAFLDSLHVCGLGECPSRPSRLAWLSHDGDSGTLAKRYP